MLTQVLWFDRFIQINSFCKKFSLKNKTFLMQLVDRNGVFKDWNALKHEYDVFKSICISSGRNL